MGQGMPFRAGVFDGVISISALQWLCYQVSVNCVKRAAEWEGDGVL